MIMRYHRFHPVRARVLIRHIIYIYINIRYYIKYVQFTYFFLFNLAYAAYSSLSDIQCRCFEEPIPRGRLGPGRIFTRNFQGSFDGRDSVL